LGIFTVPDNGYSFNVKYAIKRFGGFQRLHRMKHFEETSVNIPLFKTVAMPNRSR